jgi:hypothetical protein
MILKVGGRRGFLAVHISAAYPQVIAWVLAGGLDGRRSAVTGLGWSGRGLGWAGEPGRVWWGTTPTYGRWARGPVHPVRQHLLALGMVAVLLRSSMDSGL